MLLCVCFLSMGCPSLRVSERLRETEGARPNSSTLDLGLSTPSSCLNPVCVCACVLRRKPVLSLRLTLLFALSLSRMSTRIYSLSLVFASPLLTRTTLRQLCHPEGPEKKEKEKNRSLSRTYRGALSVRFLPFIARFLAALLQLPQPPPLPPHTNTYLWAQAR